MVAGKKTVFTHTHSVSECISLCWNIVFSHCFVPEPPLQPFCQTSCTGSVTLPWYASTRSPKCSDSSVKYVSHPALEPRHILRSERSCSCWVQMTRWRHVNVLVVVWDVLCCKSGWMEQMKAIHGRLHHFSFLNQLFTLLNRNVFYYSPKTNLSVVY